MLDSIIRNALLFGQKDPVDLGVLSGKIAEIAPRLDQECREEFDAKGYLVTPPFVDPHFHMDAALSLGLPRLNESGTLLEGIQIWGELKPDLTAEAIKNRALDLLHWSIARGTLAIRTHVDVTDPSLLAVDVLLEVKKEMQQWVDLQLVAFPQDGLLRSPNGKELLLAALDKGVDVVGGIPHFERTMEQGREATTWLCELAAARGLQVDMHCDESDDPLSRHIEHLAYEAGRTGLGAKVTGSHLTSMHSMDNYYVTKLLPLMAESGVQAICNPLINIHLQGRQDTYPKRRGLTRVPELLRAGVNVAFGHDCVMDPWYPMGSHDMLEVAHMGAHCLQMLGASQLGDIFSMVTTRAAEVMQLEDYGIEVGKKANFVVLQARSVLDAIRLKPARLAVFREGVCIAQTPEVKAEVCIGEGKRSINFLHL
jgi:cytosine deaminase